MTLRTSLVLLLASGCVSNAAVEKAQEAFDLAFGPKNATDVVAGTRCQQEAADAAAAAGTELNEPYQVLLEGTVHPGYEGSTLDADVVIGEFSDTRKAKVGAGGVWSLDVGDAVRCTNTVGDCTVEVLVTIVSEEADDSYDGTSTFLIAIEDDREELFRDADGDNYGDDDAPAELVCADDGYARVQGDCDDNDDRRNEGVASDDCDGIDNDCDEQTDEDAPTNFYWPDEDGDQYGDDAIEPLERCADPSTTAQVFVTNGDDCDDTRTDVYLDAPELCDGVDNNCDGNEDESFDFFTYFADADGDGAGDGVYPLTDCVQPIGYVLNADDCDDNDDQNFPDNDEVCDGQDNDCDGLVDSFDPSNTEGDFFHVDLDGDGLLGLEPIQQCTQPAGTEGVDWATTANPPSQYLDADCNDDPITGASFNFDDADIDGVTSCPRSALEEPDCNDADNTISPLLPEVVDPADVDENCDMAVACYIDTDFDDVGAALVDAFAFQVGTSSCDLPDNGFASVSGDCNDGDPAINPNMAEVFGNGWDDDCSGFAGCYADTDNDAFGDGELPNAIAVADATVQVSCDDPLGGFADDNDDCNDAEDTINPDADELPADGINQNCDAGDNDACWADVDGDTYGNSLDVRVDVVAASGAAANCEANPAYASNGDDCDDTYGTGAAINPGVQEVPGDDIDNNCDPLGADSCYVDGDNDTYGDDATPLAVADIARLDVETCASKSGYASRLGDCNDDNINVNPDGTEAPDNNEDDDCNGSWECYVDGDTDGVAGANTLDFGAACLSSGAFVAPGADCDDDDITRFPGNTAGFCSGDDSDCDPDSVDEFVLNLTQDAVYGGPTPALQLTAALADAADNDVFELCSSQTFEGTFTIDHAIDLVGSDGVAADTVTLQQPTGGADSLLTVNTAGNVLITDALLLGQADSAAAEGGCLNVQAGTMNLTDVNFLSCMADDGGALFADSLTDLTWTRGTCSSSTAFVDNGGCVSTAGTASLESVAMDDNFAQNNGGAVYVASPGQLTWVSGSCSLNRAENRGGCFYSGSGADVTLGVVGGDGLIIEGDVLADSFENTAGSLGNQGYVAGTAKALSNVTMEPAVTLEADVFIGATGQWCWLGAFVDGTQFSGSAGAEADEESSENYCTAAVCNSSCPL